MNRRWGMRAGRIWLCMAVAALGLWGWANGFVPASVRAEQSRELLRIQMTVQPEELVEPGDVMLTFTIENVSAVDAQSVYLSSADGLLSEPIGQIAAGEAQSFSRQHSVTEAELEGGEITYIVSYDDPNDPESKVNCAASAQIRRSDILPQVEFTRQFSGRSVAEGGTLSVVYRIRNTGNVALVNLRVEDALGDFTGRVERLEAGESRALISRVTVTEEAVSEASLSYGAEGLGDEIFVDTLDDVSVGLANPGLAHSFSAEYSAFSQDVANVVLVLDNTGNVDYAQLCVTDELNGGVIADGLSLPAGGDALEISRACAVRGEGAFCWRVTGVNESGEKINFVTDELRLDTDAERAFEPLEISAEALTPRIRRSGDVTIRVRITNPGDAQIEDIALSEASAGALRTFAVLPAGGTIERDVSFHVTDDANYLFSISYSDPDGEAHTADAAAEVVIASDGVLPEGASPRLVEFSGGSIKIGGSSTFAVLLIVGVVVLLVLLALLLIANRKARLERQMRLAAEKQRRREGQAKPGRAAQKNKSRGRNP